MSVSAQQEPRFSLKELIEASGISERNIRYYIQEGLVPRARGRGRSAYYTTEHLERLARVMDLRNRGLSLDEIRETVATPPAATSAPSETWERIILHPQLEIHVASDAPEAVRMLVARFTQVAEEWFGSQPDEPAGDPWT